jgi:hypothetical protein
MHAQHLGLLPTKKPRRSAGDTKRQEYDLFTSEVVIAEVSQGDTTMSQAQIEILTEITRLPAQTQVDEIIEQLLPPHHKRYAAESDTHRNPPHPR